MLYITLNSITILQFHEFSPLQIVSDDDVLHHYMYVNVCMQAPLYQMNATRPCDVYRGRTLQYIVSSGLHEHKTQVGFDDASSKREKFVTE